MIYPRLLILFSILLISQITLVNVYAQVAGDKSPFERDFGDVKFLDAYFGIADEKIEVSPGDRNVPFTVVAANVGTQDITGIKGQLSMPFGFSASDGPGSLIIADADSTAIAGEVFTLTFFVNVKSLFGSRSIPVGKTVPPIFFAFFFNLLIFLV